ncbi:CobD/CbiB family cobalamin biosynthesis protein [Haloprofundus marisrubri]|uniref:Probable cobalamin biosynthesis protein CobD n=1 Tax=Haloprofundus marisrubri TaxID=1514971 RepID=A0A0W1RC63_9EURY|nr:adenosylcobinamide-phosphate synthase CbiB [Haloprofundus marisrubri]KTG10977.1 CobD/CbiB family cobalamin biosynthesis protein [Haloprofundus marisrubri]
MIPAASGAIALAAALDWLFREPPARVHPVALLGRLVSRVDQQWSRPRLLGAVAAFTLPLVAAGAAALLVGLAALVGHTAMLLATGFVLFSTTSLRMLLDAARSVVDDSDTDPDAAKQNLRALAGRDPTDLSSGELRSAAVESAAENLADGLVAPLLAFTVLAPLSLPVAAAAAAWVKAVNTLDSMLGYRDKPVGWAPARLDDVVMWLPARVSAVLVAVASGDLGSLARAREWSQNPPSPNSGWPMATLAAVLDVRLDKPDVYVLNRNVALPTPADATHGIRIVAVAGAFAWGLAFASTLLASRFSILDLLSGAAAWF